MLVTITSESLHRGSKGLPRYQLIQGEIPVYNILPTCQQPAHSVNLVASFCEQIHLTAQDIASLLGSATMSVNPSTVPCWGPIKGSNRQYLERA